MAKLKKKSVQEAVEEMSDAERCELALELHRDKLDKMYKKRDKLDADIESMEMAIELFEAKLGEMA